MENILITLFSLGLAFGVGVVVGVYITTQIGNWIDKQINKKND